MVDEHGKLSQADKEKFAAWLKRKRVNPECPSCGHNNWTIGDHLLNGQVFTHGGGLIFGGPSYPFAFMVCGNCGYLRQYAAVPAGIVTTDESSGGEDE